MTRRFDRFHWTLEDRFPGYTLREARGYALAVLTRASATAPWYGSILAPGNPSSPRCTSAAEAADWVVAEMKRGGRVKRGARVPSVADAKGLPA